MFKTNNFVFVNIRTRFFLDLFDPIIQSPTPKKFCADHKLQSGQYREAMQFVREMFHNKRESGDNTVVFLKLATVHYCMGDYRSAAQNIVECVSQLDSLPPGWTSRRSSMDVVMGAGLWPRGIMQRMLKNFWSAKVHI